MWSRGFQDTGGDLSENERAGVAKRQTIPISSSGNVRPGPGPESSVLFHQEIRIPNHSSGEQVRNAEDTLREMFLPSRLLAQREICGPGTRPAHKVISVTRAS